MKKFLITLLFLFFLILFPRKTSAMDIEEQLRKFDFSQTQEDVSEYDISVVDLIIKAIKGELDLTPGILLENLARKVFNEIGENFSLIKNLIIVGILSAFLKNLADSFKRKEIAELGFYVSYIVLIIILFNSFKIAIGIMTDCVSVISNIMATMIPVIVSLLAASGRGVSAAAFNPVMALLTNVIVKIINDYVAPILTIVAVLQTINFLSTKESFTKLNEGIRKGVSAALYAVGVFFITILSLQRISTPIANSFAARAAKISVGAVPVVGEVFAGAVDTVVYLTSAAKGGFMAAAAVILITVAAVPIIKLVVMIFIYKVVAALLEPICEDRFSDCIDAVGSLTSLALVTTFIVLGMFLFNVLITLSI